jgi:hypothetical protein
MEVAVVWRTLKNDLVGSYRPELHYMRGPVRNGVKSIQVKATNHRAAVYPRR